MERYAVLAAVVCASVLGCVNQPEPVDLVVRGGTIITMNPAQPRAQALAARGQRIVAVGSNEDVDPLIGPQTRVLDLAGAVAYPGFIEAHAHFLGIGAAQMQLDLKNAASWDEIVAQVAKEASDAERGVWIRGRGWHQEKWGTAPAPGYLGLPYHDGLSAVSPDNPVILTHASGHAVMVNQLAMELAGIDETTADPPGGEIVRDATGRPIGVLREDAETLVVAVLPPEDSERSVRQKVERATGECLAKGLTSFQDAGSSLVEAAHVRAMAEAGELEIRLSLMLDEDNATIAPHLDAVRVVGAGGGYFTVRGIKRWIDGALGSHGAWLLEPYADLPASTGINTEPLDSMEETAELAAEHGYQFCVHAIGDRANRETLNIFERTLAAHPELEDARWRIEHAQHLAASDIPRFGELGVIASMQPVHCTSDGPWVPDRLGSERAQVGSYAWRALLDSDARIAAGTDAPVEDVDPLKTFAAAVTRRMANGEVFVPDQRMTRAEALRAMTLDAAWAVFEEHDKGSLETGKLADLTVLSRNLLEIPEEDFETTEVVATVVGGMVRYQLRDWKGTDGTVAGEDR